MPMSVGPPIYIVFAVVRVAVGAVHRSCVVRREGAVGIRRGDFPAVRMFVGWGPVSFCDTCLYLTVVFPFNWNLR